VVVVLEKDEEGQENLHEDGQGQGGDRGLTPPQQRKQVPHSLARTWPALWGGTAEKCIVSGGARVGYKVAR